jgi:hypothetical protein
MTLRLRFLALIIISFCSGLLDSTQANAQVIIEGLYWNPFLNKAFQSQQNRLSLSRTASIQSTNRVIPMVPRLGFFDDFSVSVNNSPDTNKWLPGSGVYINNSFAIRPPSLNAATFDGMRASGLPYSDTLAVKGYCDTLTSRMINLRAGLRPGDFAELRFSLQPGSRAPSTIADTNSSILIQFNKNIPTDSTWRNFYRQKGIDEIRVDSFYRVFIEVPDSFITNAFQFRFINFGQRNGWFDTWNLDYIQLHKLENNFDTLSDITYTSPISPLFKKYTALPRAQFQAGYSQLFRDTLFAETRNNRPEPLLPITFVPSIRFIAQPQNRLIGVVDPSQIEGSFFSPPNNIKLVNVTALRNSFPRLDTLPDSTKSIVVQYALAAQGTQNAITTNDTISTTYKIDNQYAYDDGTAEAVLFVQGPSARGAVEFDAFEADTLTAVSMYFPPIRPIPSITTPISFLLRVWQRIGRTPTDRDSIVYQSSEIINFSDQLQGFTKFTLPRPVRIEQGKFYVGWQQISNVENEVRVGFDLNYTDSSRFWFNRDGYWTRFTGAQGVPMIRAEFGTFQDPSNANSEIKKQALRVYPNPLSGNVLYVTGAAISSATLLDLQGKILSTTQVQDNEVTLLQKPKAGMYLLKTVGIAGVQVVKVVVE